MAEINPDYPNVNFDLAEAKGFDVQNFQKLAAKYKMLGILAERIMDDEMPNFRLDDDNVGKILRPIFAQSNITTPPTHKSDASSGYTLRLPKGKHKALHVEIMPKTDPTSLFMGRIVKVQ